MANSYDDEMGPVSDAFRGGLDEVSALPGRAAAQVTPGRVAALGNGLAMGGGARLGAALQGILAKVKGQDFTPTYNAALSENRGIEDAERAAEPGVATALEAVGAIPTTLATAGVGPEARAAGLLPKLAASMKTGAALGGVRGLVGSRGDLGSTQNALETTGGLVGGGALGLAGPLVEHGVGAVANAAVPRAAPTSALRSVLQRLADPYRENLAVAARPSGALSGRAIADKAEGYLQSLRASPAGQATAEREAYDGAMSDATRRRALTADKPPPLPSRGATAVDRPTSPRFKTIQSFLDDSETGS